MEHRKLEGMKQKEDECKQVRGEVESVFTPDQCRGVKRSTKCLNQWLTVAPNTENNSILGKDKFCNMVLLQYKIILKDLPKVCDGCGKRHTLKDKEEDPNLYRDLLKCSLWQAQMDTIINVWITDADAKSYISRSLESVLTAQEKEKKISTCNPALISIATSPRLSHLLMACRPLATNYVKTTMSLSIICATHSCHKESQVPSRIMSTYQVPCEYGAAIRFLLLAED
eukprot:8549447-Ditylum_brightwellii.AAC.1